MDDVVNRFARELADAIAAAVAENPQVEACRERARAAGFEMKVTLEAVVGFVNRSQSTAMTKVAAPARVLQPRRSFEVTANDRRFLRSLRIAADETAEPVAVRNHHRNHPVTGLFNGFDLGFDLFSRHRGLAGFDERDLRSGFHLNLSHVENKFSVFIQLLDPVINNI